MRTLYFASRRIQKRNRRIQTGIHKETKSYLPGVSKKIIKNNELAIEGKFLFTIGTLEPRKNISTVIEAYLLIKEKPNFDYKLVIASRRGWGQEELTARLLSGELEKKASSS